MKNSLFNEVFTDPVYLTACGFGTGLIPKAPGTFGTLVAVPMIAALAWLQTGVQLVCLLVMFLVGVHVCQKVSKSLGDDDPGAVVWDEIVGFCVAMTLVPLSLATLIVGFVLFRILDIFKPWPISWVERKFSGGFGIMIDDMIAGVFCNVVLQVLIYMNYL